MAGPHYEKGVYRAKVKSQTIGESKSGSPQWLCRFEILGKVQNGHLGECENYERTLYCSLTEKGIPFLLEDVRRLCEVGGVEFVLPRFECLDERTEGFLDLRGVEFNAYCKHEEYKGATKERWSIAKYDSKPQAAAPRRSLFDDLNKQFASELTPAKRKYPSVPLEYQEDVDSDELPF